MILEKSKIESNTLVNSIGNINRDAYFFFISFHQTNNNQPLKEDGLDLVKLHPKGKHNFRILRRMRSGFSNYTNT